jgi:hypothetical protein
MKKFVGWICFIGFILDCLKETWKWFIENQDEYLRKKNYFADE